MIGQRIKRDTHDYLTVSQKVMGTAQKQKLGQQLFVCLQPLLLTVFPNLLFLSSICQASKISVRN